MFMLPLKNLARKGLKYRKWRMDGLAPDSSNSIANALELL